MSKELEALKGRLGHINKTPLEEALDRLYECNDDDYTLGYQQHDYKLLQQALKRLEAIDNANPSEALECLKQIEDIIETKIGLGVVNAYIINIIKQALEKAQEQEKFFDDRLSFKDGSLTCGFDYKGKDIVAMPLNEYDKFMQQEEVLQIIRRKGLPIVERNMLMLCENYEQYCDKYDNYNMINASMRKTEEEFNLLKRYYYEEKH